jgi:hypothetical protein
MLTAITALALENNVNCDLISTAQKSGPWPVRPRDMIGNVIEIRDQIILMGNIEHFLNWGPNPYMSG